MGSESFGREVGDPLKLSLLIEEDDKFVKANIYDNNNSLLGSASLSLAAEGLYVNDTELMPNQDQLKAVYRVYEDAGFTELDCTYPPSLDYFEKVTPMASANINATRVKTSISTNSTKVGAKIIDGKISTIIDSNNIATEIASSQKIKGKILNSQTITGVVYDEQ